MFCKFYIFKYVNQNKLMCDCFDVKRCAKTQFRPTTVLLHFSAGTEVFYESADELHADMFEVLEDLRRYA